MMFSKKIMAVGFMMLFFLTKNAFGAYPEKNIMGYISFGAGGGTDNLSRAVSPLAEKYLKKVIVLTNRSGAVGSVAHTYVCTQPADGYTLLYQAENPSLYKILGLGKYDWDDVEPVMLFLQGITVLCVTPDTPYKTFEDFLSAAKEKKLTMATTGVGGLPYVAGAMMKSIDGVEANFVQFESDGTAATAMLGGHVKIMPMAISASLEYIKSGRLRPLVVFNKERVPQLPDVPAITEKHPEYGKFLPWGPFYGVFVRKETPVDIIVKLRDAFSKAVAEPRFDQLCEQLGGIKLAITGDKAFEYLKKNQAIAAWLVYDTGGSKISPEKFNIPRP